MPRGTARVILMTHAIPPFPEEDAAASRKGHAALSYFPILGIFNQLSSARAGSHSTESKR
jgi:hypothetical protein